MTRLCLPAGLLLATLAIAPTWADDDTPSVPLPPLQASPAGTITATSVGATIINGHVAVKTRLAVSGAPSLSLQWPSFAWQGEGEAYPDRQFSELRITVDGKPATVTDESTESFHGTDVTGLIREAQLDPFMISDPVPVVTPVSGADPAAYAKLRSLGAIADLGGAALARWSAVRRISWSLTAGEHDLELAYQLRPAASLQDLAHAQTAKVCLTAKQFATLAGHAQSGGNVLVSRYDIPAGIAHRPSTAALSVNNPDGTPSDTRFIVFCGPSGEPVIGNGNQIAGTARLNPAGDIDLLTLEKP